MAKLLLCLQEMKAKGILDEPARTSVKCEWINSLEWLAYVRHISLVGLLVSHWCSTLGWWLYLSLLSMILFLPFKSPNPVSFLVSSQQWSTCLDIFSNIYICSIVYFWIFKLFMFSLSWIGLTASPLYYVDDVSPGLPLFSFSYSDRRIHGIFETAT